MAIQQENVRFTLKSVIAATAESLASLWKPLLVAAPLLGTALFFASGAHAQTGSSTAPPNQTTEATTVAPKPAPDAARRGRGPKSKTAEDTGRAAVPASTTESTATGPIAPIASPDAARTGTTQSKNENGRGYWPRGGSTYNDGSSRPANGKAPRGAERRWRERSHGNARSGYTAN